MAPRHLVARWCSVLSATLIVTFLPSMAWAQERVNEQGLVRVIEIEVRPDAIGEWARLQGEELIPAQLAGGYPWVDVWRAGGAGNPYFRSVVVPMTDLTELDDASVFERVLGLERAETLLDRHRRLVTSVNTRIVRPRPELGFGTRARVPNVGVLVTVTVANGRTQEFEERVRTSVMPELVASNVAAFVVGEILFGGRGNQYFTLMYFENFETVAIGHPATLAWVMGSNGIVRIADEPNSPIIDFERTILRFDPELSSGTRQ